MGLITDVRVRQPAKDDLVGRRFLVAGIGNGFEGTIGIRVLDGRGRVLAEDSAQSVGGMAAVGEFSTRVTVPHPPRDGTRLTVQVFGDNPGLPDEGPSPGFNLREVEVIMFAELRGFLLYRVEAGDTLASIVRTLRDFTRTTVAQVVAANPRITDPDVIRVGQRLRIPQKD
ncbi:Gmad2 immunoglobulin-like domain-containing protein [Nocardioides sp. zg-1230]|uniref:Gmad2 immunoglobulin-like domain-containing protein n=1 Tax=Nocardioides sp. zg-1230 TaxID=2736601 RepID=UPI001556B333|nr:Gmad2 immunoglobulin-like domain-containing protein [Nocardioides sp. zg-1230]NPC42530.1 LysM peptidoglycan-binding domain-containing protein [Nocardioides sp. zg-1230]